MAELPGGRVIGWLIGRMVGWPDGRPLALHLWLHFHSPSGVATSSPLLVEAEKIVLADSGTSPNFQGARPFFLLFAIIQGSEEPFYRGAVYAAGERGCPSALLGRPFWPGAGPALAGLRSRALRCMGLPSRPG